jgi:Thiamine pyrophosphate enzyme, C-terminal TPP binding domain
VPLTDSNFVSRLNTEHASGGFLFSAMELEAAVRLKSNLVHMILIDGSYDMVAEQEILKYGRPLGTDFGPVDPVKYAEAFGAKGLMILSPDQIPSCGNRHSILRGQFLSNLTSTIATIASCLSKSTSEVFTKANASAVPTTLRGGVKFEMKTLVLNGLWWP